FSLIYDQLKQLNKKIDQRFVDRIPKIVFSQKTNTVFTVSTTGFDDHHKTFKDILKRLVDLYNTSLLKQKSIEYSNQFNVAIEKFIFELSEKLIQDKSLSSWNQIQNYTEQFIKDNIFENQIEQLKHQALEQFIT
ncbi:unnamed protein product, partial [Rotaria socialis]